MKKLRSFTRNLTLCSSLAALSLSPLATLAESNQLLDRVAIVVNNGAILESDINSMLISVRKNAAQSRQQLPDDDVLRSQIVERLIIDRIIEQLAQTAGIQITDADVDRGIQDIAKQNNISVAQLRQHLAADGLTYKEYREQIRKEIMLAETRNSEVRRRINILPQEVDALSEQIVKQQGNIKEFNLSHIIIALPEEPTRSQSERAEKRYNTLMTQIEKGGDFAKLASTYSDDGQGSSGGLMGWGKLEEIPEFFAERIQYANTNDIVGPIRSPFGIHILKVNDIRKGAPQKITATEYHAQHILIKSSIIMSEQQVVDQLHRIANQIKAGTLSFADAAKANSQDPGTSQQGGDLGWSVSEIYDPAFRNGLLSLKVNEMSTPIQSEFGWHLIELLGAREIDATSDARKDQAYRMLFNRKFTEQAQTWMQELRASAYIRFLD